MISRSISSLLDGKIDLQEYTCNQKNKIFLGLYFELRHEMDPEIRDACWFSGLLDMKNKDIFDKLQEPYEDESVSYP
jgi:hypothetical protein